MANKIKILFLAADPRDTQRLRLGEEARAISEAIRRGEERDALEFASEWAVRTGDVQAALQRHQPQIVHFSGHADRTGGIYLEDQDGLARAVGRHALKGLFSSSGKSVRVVVLNACASLSAVDAFRGVVDYCIGMNRPITDDGARVFAEAFYGALSSGSGVAEAYEAGKVRLQIEGFEVKIPVLRVRRGAGRWPIEPPPDPDAPDRADEMQYLRTLVSRLDAVELFGGGDGGDRGRLRITEVFTSPNLTLTRAPDQSLADALRDGASTAAGASAEDRIRVMAIDALAGVPRLALIGEPGGGKSMLLAYVAVQLARQRLGEPDVFLPGWDQADPPLPVVVLLRELAEWLSRWAQAGPAPAGSGLVWEYLAHLLRSWGCPGAEPALREAIRTGRAAVFFDGLDEVAESGDRPRRTLLANAIREFAAPLPGGRVVVTCRRYAYRPDDPWRLPAEFPVVELDRFGLGQIRQFAVQWYRSLARREGWSGEVATRRGVLLYEQIRDAAHLKALAESPLLLTLMARVHREEQTLPEDRAQLYDRAIDLLLAEWENGKETGRPGEASAREVAALGVPTAALRSALAELAFGSHARPEGREGGAASIARIDLLECLEGLAGGLDRARAFIRYIETRAGLLVLREDLTYAFPHRTFQEYLAAVHVVARPAYADELLGRLRGDFAWWREVFFLAAATLARDPDRLAVLADAVLAEAEDAPAAEDLVQAASFVALAMAAGPFAVHADRVKRFARLRSRMQGVLSAAMLQAGGLSAAVRSAAGFALARIGDPRRELRCPEAMPFRFVPAGPFWMGSPHDDPDAYPEEVPLHRAEVPYDCWIGRFPVTVAQFAANVRAEAGEPRPLAPGAADTQPATASWHEARAFCRWLGERLRAAAPRALEQAAPGDRAHAFWTGLADGSLAAALPSEAEWEKAARGAEGHPRYPWGDAADPQRANYEDAGVGSASVVGCVPGGASPFGVEEASGNVWEWTRSLWGQDKERPSFRYPYDPADGREDWRAGDDVRRVVRGGSFHSPARSIRCSSRFGVLPAVVSPNFGFRVVVAPTAVLETRPRPAGNRRKASSRGAEKKAG